VARSLLDVQKLRRAEQREKGARAPVEKWDDLFHVAFTGPSGEYEAGNIAADQKEQLPADAVATVQQLLIWLPDDLRLYWLLGELYNAKGEYLTAGEIFAEVGEKLQRAVKSGFEIGIKAEEPGGSKRAKRRGTAPPQVAKSLESRSIAEFTRLPEPYKGHLAVLIAQAKADQEAATARRSPQNGAPPGMGGGGPEPNKVSSTPAGDSGDALPIDFRSLGVGFVAGLIVMLFGLWQGREIRRRLGRGSPPAEAGPWPAAGSQEGVAVKREEGRPG